MKLVNHTLLYFSITLFLILAAWAGIFYVNMLDEVYDSLDDGLDNYKMLIIQRAEQDSSVLYKTNFAESNYAVHEIHSSDALNKKDVYKDTLMYMMNEEDYEPVRILTTAFRANNGKYYQLKVISSMVEEDDLIEDLLYSLIGLYIAMLVSILLINNFILRRTWKPFYTLLEKLKTFRLDTKENIELPRTNITEFKNLNSTIKDLLGNTIKTYNNQKQLIENASHELQTPLAISINKLELLLEKEQLNDESAHTIGEVMQTLERLTRINRSLLLLSKIENKQFPDSLIIAVNPMVKKMVNDLEDWIAHKELKVEIEEKQELEFFMNADLAEILISNLVKNAIHHTKKEGELKISITPERISVSNSGDASLDAARIFTRFYKESTSVQSSGLGLAIVKSIADAYHLKLNYTFQDNLHQFTLSK